MISTPMIHALEAPLEERFIRTDQNKFDQISGGEKMMMKIYTLVVKVNFGQDLWGVKMTIVQLLR